MPDPISSTNICRTPAPDYDAMMSEATGMPLQGGATVNRTPEAPRHDPTGTLVTGTAGVVVDTFGEAAATGGGVVASAAGSALAVYELISSAAHTFGDGEKARVLHDHNVLRGALAYFEGRAGSPEVINRAQRDPAFAEGLRRADAFVRTNAVNSSRVVEFTETIRRAAEAGISAVSSGRDRGAEFECRLASDIVFRHGVEYARALRERVPAEFARRQALDNAVNDARRGQFRP